jgi:hypothetical protein
MADKQKLWDAFKSRIYTIPQKIPVSDACDAFILTVVNHKINAVPKFANRTWILWQVSETEVNQTYLTATKQFIEEENFINRLSYVLNNMWPVECANCNIVANHDGQYASIKVVRLQN